jgi:hypothetical protein
MSQYGDSFKDIDFDKPWEEEDWERFFEAQDRMVREAEARLFRSRNRPAAADSLAFREVLRRFGMDPDRPLSDDEDPSPESAERELASDPSAGASSDFSRDGVNLQTLPVYCDARRFAARVILLCERRFLRMMNKIYRSESHRRVQSLLVEWSRLVVQVPGTIASGHGLGYSPDVIKGNIVRCRKALSLADESLGKLSRIPSRRFSPGEYRSLFRENARLRNALNDWISVLRRRSGQSG